MRVAVCGKGGVGKTAVAALLVRALAERGWDVLAVDLDSNPGLGISLGLDVADVVLPDEAVEERAGVPYGWGLAADLDAATAVTRWAVPVSDRVRFFGVGNITGAQHPLARYMTAVRTVADGFAEPGWAVVLDIEAGPATPFEGFARIADPALVLAEATPASLLAAQRVLSILDAEGTPREVVVAKTRPGDVELVASALGCAPLAALPLDPAVRDAERRGGLLDLPASTPLAQATGDLAALLLNRTVEVAR